MASPLAFVFPGQGSQSVGMGRAVYEASARARAVFDEADRILGYKLSEICFSGPAAKLDDTRVAQPAILTTSVALLEALAEDAADAPGRLSDGHEPRGRRGAARRDPAGLRRRAFARRVQRARRGKASSPSRTRSASSRSAAGSPRRRAPEARWLPSSGCPRPTSTG